MGHASNQPYGRETFQREHRPGGRDEQLVVQRLGSAIRASARTYASSTVSRVESTHCMRYCTVTTLASAGRVVGPPSPGCTLPIKYPPASEVLGVSPPSSARRGTPRLSGGGPVLGRSA